MLKTVLSISGRPGLYKLVSQGKNMLIVEAIGTGKRMPAYAHDKIISLGDIAIYTMEEDIPLADVFESIKVKNEGKAVDVKAMKSDKEIREYFATVLPEFDDERVYTNDIKKVFNWYNVLVAAGMTEFKSAEAEEANEE
ncbi:MAG: DUF5606 domain-containing protein [Muribaculaceae bacterium]|jgi:hypothetical protein|nr:DUF5606 domain-containing protein [Muribaculaceae bacterium]